MHDQHDKLSSDIESLEVELSASTGMLCASNDHFESTAEDAAEQAAHDTEQAAAHALQVARLQGLAEQTHHVAVQHQHAVHKMQVCHRAGWSDHFQ